MPTEEDVRESLKAIYDPDMPANIVDLGLVYRIQVDDGDVYIRMTMTRPGSPLKSDVADEVKEHVLDSVEGVEDVRVDVVWDPAWTPDMMSEDARANLGL